MIRTVTSLLLCALVCLAGLAPTPAAAAGGGAGPVYPGMPDGRGDYDDLKSLFAEFLEWRAPEGVDGVVDYSPRAIRGRRAAMRRYQRRLDDMNVTAWPREQQVDYLLVRAHFDEQDFVLNVTQPWKRDPNYYSADLMTVAFTDLPVEGTALEKLKTDLAAAPAILAAAKENLTDIAGDYADFAIFNLTNSDNINHMHPYREVPPAGAIGWYKDLLARTDAQPELAQPARAALDALKDYHAWLVAGRAEMTGLNGVGETHLDWYLKHVKMLPYTSDQILAVAEQEKDRLLAFLALEEHRNRGLPQITLPQSREEYEARIAETDRRIRDFLREEEFITIPPYIPEDWREIGFNVPFMEREVLNFWEQVQFRDPTPDHLHAVIPGHRIDTRIENHVNHPIRKVSFGDRREGWAVYLEEAALQAGLMDDQPRTRELIYIFGMWRAVRTVGDVRNQTNAYTTEQTIDYWMKWTPYLDRGVARKYSYLRPTPAHSLHYTMGAIEMRRLLADRKNQLGEAFVLKDFHDEFMSRGRIPIALIRYEMLGDEEDIAVFWDRTPLSDLR